MKLTEVKQTTHPQQNVILQRLRKYLPKLDSWSFEIRPTDDSYVVDMLVPVALRKNNMTHLPVNFGNVNGFFDCRFNQLKDFKGFPTHVNGPLYMNGNSFSSFHNIHKHIKVVNGIISCDVRPNMLGLLMINGVTRIQTPNNPAVGEIMTNYKDDVLACQEALIDAGFVKEAKL